MVSEPVGKRQRNFHLLHSFALQVLVPMAKIFQVEVISHATLSIRTVGGGRWFEQLL